MMYYLFMDNESGEEFFVEADSVEEAMEICCDNEFEDVELEAVMTEAESEWYPYDVY